uniref:EB domain-containing protein n=1 Tax=Ditylenchus dipsaci TaxID=166011 RepID=A0A915CL41_9BILA
MIPSTIFFDLILCFLFLLQIKAQQSEQKQLANGLNSCPAGTISLYTNVLCAIDQHCQQVATGSFCFRGKCCLPSVSNGNSAGYGASCTADRHCAFSNSECRNLVCYCRLPYIYNSRSKTCRPYNADESEEVNDALTRAQPIQIKCSQNQITFDGKCLDLVNYNGICEYSHQCDFRGGVCLVKRCLCPGGQIYDGNGQGRGVKECVSLNGPPILENQKRMTISNR